MSSVWATGVHCCAALEVQWESRLVGGIESGTPCFSPGDGWSFMRSFQEARRLSPPGVAARSFFPVHNFFPCFLLCMIWLFVGPTPALTQDCLLYTSPPAQKPPETPTKKPKPQTTANPETGAKEQKPAADAEKEQKPGMRPALKNFGIDRDGIQNRIVALPIPPANLQTLTAAKGVIFYISAPIQGLSGPLPGEPPAIHAYDLKDRKDHIFLEGADQYALSFDGKKILYGTPKGGEGGELPEHNWGIVDVKVPEGEKESEPKALVHAGEGALKLDALRMEVDPPAEWKQIFNEVWRQERDYFYEPAMNGVNWQEEHDKYAQLLPYVADRLSLTYVLGELIGELSNSHTYVGGGDYPEIETVNVGLLGAELEPDANSGMYRLAKIYPGENWNRNLRSPLTEPGVMVKEGDYLLAVNGRPLRVPQNPDERFVDTVNQTTTLSVNSKPTEQGAHNVVVRPVPVSYTHLSS